MASRLNYPQLRDPKFPEPPDHHMWELSKLEKIYEPSEKEYLNALLFGTDRILNTLGKYLLTLNLLVLALFILFVYKLFL